MKTLFVIGLLLFSGWCSPQLEASKYKCSVAQFREAYSRTGEIQTGWISPDFVCLTAQKVDPTIPDNVRLSADKYIVSDTRLGGQCEIQITQNGFGLILELPFNYRTMCSFGLVDKTEVMPDGRSVEWFTPTSVDVRRN